MFYLFYAIIMMMIMINKFHLRFRCDFVVCMRSMAQNVALPNSYNEEEEIILNINCI